MRKTKNKTQGQSPNFDYAKFEREAIEKLRQGGDLIGPDGIFRDMIKRIVSAAMEGEVQGHLSEEKSRGQKGNRRNGHTSKKLQTSLGEVQINPPRDRTGTFSPQIVGKWDRKLNSGLDSQILELYSLGNSMLDIQTHMEKMYGVGLSTGQISLVTEQVWKEVVEWQSRPLDSFYALIYLDAIHFKIREDGEIKTKAVYTVFGVDAYGQRDLLGLTVGQSEGAKQWGRVLENIKSRGVEDVLFFSVDGLKGFSQAIQEVFPQSIVQRCIVHMIRTSLRFVADKDYKAICKDLRFIYTADDEEAGLMYLEKFAQKWDEKYPEISKKWYNDWEELTAFFGYNKAIRRMIYTTNAVEALHRHMRKVTKTKGAFTNDKALLKLLYLSLMRKRKSWARKVFQWSEVQRGLVREFGERYTKHIEI